MRRGTDRVESLVLLLAGVLAALVVPVAAALGTGAQAAAADAAARARSGLYVVSARTLEDAAAPALSVRFASVNTVVQVTWTDRTGTPRTGRMPVAPGTEAGSEITMWVDSAGRPRQAPATHAATVLAGIRVALLVLVLAWSGISLAVVMTRRSLDRRRWRRWEAEWRLVAPRWTGRVG